jgi:hypothetical protein
MPGKKQGHGRAIALGAICVIGVVFLVVMAFQPISATGADPAASNPPPTSTPPAENTTVYATNRVVEVNASLYNNATKSASGWTNVQSATNYTIITLPASYGQTTAYKILASNTTLAKILGQPLACANSSAVIFKLVNAPIDISGRNPRGIGFIFHANSTWWADQYSYIWPTLDAANWPAMAAILIGLSN